MTAGLPGAGIGGMFYLLMALLAPLWETVRARRQERIGAAMAARVSPLPGRRLDSGQHVARGLGDRRHPRLAVRNRTKQRCARTSRHTRG